MSCILYTQTEVLLQKKKITITIKFYTWTNSRVWYAIKITMKGIHVRVQQLTTVYSDSKENTHCWGTRAADKPIPCTKQSAEAVVLPWWSPGEWWRCWPAEWRKVEVQDPPPSTSSANHTYRQEDSFTYMYLYHHFLSTELDPSWRVYYNSTSIMKGLAH